jgi:Flp pilus assembly protein protease CpaA
VVGAARGFVTTDIHQERIGIRQMTPLYVSIPVLVWLSVCAWFDWKSRRVSNWLTLPVLVVVIVIRILGYGLGDWRFVWLLSVLVILGWAAKLVGGADAKVSLAIILLEPGLAVWSWAGGVVWYFAILIFSHSCEKPFSLPGMMGFSIGIFANICLSVVS